MSKIPKWLWLKFLTHESAWRGAKCQVLIVSQTAYTVGWSILLSTCPSCPLFDWIYIFGWLNAPCFLSFVVGSPFSVGLWWNPWNPSWCAMVKTWLILMVWSFIPESESQHNVKIMGIENSWKFSKFLWIDDPTQKNLRTSSKFWHGTCESLTTPQSNTPSSDGGCEWQMWKRAKKNLINPPLQSSVISVSVSFGKRTCCNVAG